MDVKSFVTETIVQICEGVTEAVTRLEASDAIVSPSGIAAADNNMYVHEGYRRIVQNVEFDVAVTVTEAQGKSALKMSGNFAADSALTEETCCQTVG